MFEVFNDIEFFEGPHKYKFTKFPDIDPVSVTGIIGKYKEPFNSEYWSKRKADSLGIPQSAILKQWDDNKNLACDKGTLCHYYLETFYGNKQFEIADNLSRADVLKAFETTKPKMKQFIQDNLKVYRPVVSELIVGCPELQITGMIDQVFEEIETGDLYIFDWKTNKAINSSSRYMMIGAMSHLDACEMNTYSLQLGLYKHIIEKRTGLKIKGCKLVHFPIKGEDYVIYNIKDLTKEVDSIVKEHIDSLR